ncbi:hypothetical protein HGRIS_006390 [Hohenbuehelia grisea]|uniref:Uncharacterized protein n=1 Tax=Hohenbuehelia grisea TaxID=104357 RepID=A0ABR3JZR6_9AGAR
MIYVVPESMALANGTPQVTQTCSADQVSHCVRARDRPLGLPHWWAKAASTMGIEALRHAFGTIPALYEDSRTRHYRASERPPVKGVGGRYARGGQWTIG